jgi:hypothetical protein
MLRRAFVFNRAPGRHLAWHQRSGMVVRGRVSSKKVARARSCCGVLELFIAGERLRHRAGRARPADVLAGAAHAGVRRTGCSGRPGAPASLPHLATRGGSRCSPVARKWRSRRKIQGRPAPRGRSSRHRRRWPAAPAALARGCDVAIGHHRDAQRGLDGGHRVVLGRAAFVALLAGAAVHGEHRDAGLFGARRAAGRCGAWHQPVRIFSVTGTPRGAQAATTASTMAAPAARPASAPSPPTCCTPSWPGSPC